MPELTIEQILALQGIPTNTTVTRPGIARNEACQNFALTGGMGGDFSAPLFAVINAGDNETLQLALNDCPVDLRETILDVRRAHQVELNAGGVRAAASVQNTVRTVVEMAVGASGLVITQDHTPYYICMHWPTADGVTYEHWWLELFGVTVEIIPAWPDIKIYSPRLPDPPHYSQVRVPLRELHQSHIDRIQGVFDANYTIPTDPSGGWS